MLDAVPYPPIALANRVGSLVGHENPFGFYDLLGRETRSSLISLLPSDWEWEGKSILDFGCGAGRTLRHFLPEAEVATFWGCDIDAESIEWLRTNISPPIQAFVNDELPPLPLDSDSLDLVYAVSVFTHLTDAWSAWLLELHRVLKDGALLIATFIGPGAAHHVTDEVWEADRIGMNVLKPGQSWDLGGPVVLHSPWWIAAHWGRAFEISEVALDGFGLASPEGHGVVAMRKRPVEPSVDDLERPDPDEPRETVAALSNVRQLSRELARLRGEHEQLAAAWRAESEGRAAAEERTAEVLGSSDRRAPGLRSRVLQPLRRLGRMLLEASRR